MVYIENHLNIKTNIYIILAALLLDAVILASPSQPQHNPTSEHNSRESQQQPTQQLQQNLTSSRSSREVFIENCQKIFDKNLIWKWILSLYKKKQKTSLQTKNLTIKNIILMYDLYVWAGFYLFSVISNLTLLREPNNKPNLYIYLFWLQCTTLLKVIYIWFQNWGWRNGVLKKE